jgi:hypothetical protein
MNFNRVADPMSGPSRWVNSRRTGRQAPRLRELDLNSLPYVPLPRAPMRWGTQSGRAHPQMRETEALFGIRDAPWQLASMEKLAAHERPDPAFRLLYPVDSGLLVFDDLGHARGFGSIQAAALRYDRVSDRALATSLQSGPAAQLARLQTAGARSGPAGLYVQLSLRSWTTNRDQVTFPTRVLRLTSEIGKFRLLFVFSAATS